MRRPKQQSGMCGQNRKDGMRKVPCLAEHDRQRDPGRCPIGPEDSLRISVFLLKSGGVHEGCSDKVDRLRFVRKVTLAVKDEPSQVCKYS